MSTNHGTHTKALAAVLRAAEAENSWQPVGAVFTTEEEDEGIVMFAHRASDTHDYTAWGTAHFFVDVSDRDRVVFQWGHYEKGLASVLGDFADRLTSNR